jgi:hypothetical protein
MFLITLVCEKLMTCQQNILAANKTQYHYTIYYYDAKFDQGLKTPSN